MMMVDKPRTLEFVRWHPEIPRPPVEALCDITVDGQLIEGARLVEDVRLEWWGSTFRYAGRDFFFAQPAEYSRHIKPAPWAVEGAREFPRYLEGL